jgi:hypothetical protein
MRLSLWFVTFVLILQILLTASPFIPATASLWHTGEPQKFYEVFAAFVGLQMILLTATITLILLKESTEAKERLESVAARLSGTTVKPLKEFEFYIHFRGAAEVADHSVRIAYLAPYPPGDVASKERKKYDEEILHLMKVRSKVNFRRLVRQSSKNNAWVSERRCRRRCDFADFELAGGVGTRTGVSALHDANLSRVRHFPRFLRSGLLLRSCLVNGSVFLLRYSCLV